MKKSLFLAAVAATLLGSCSTDGEAPTQPDGTARTPIIFTGNVTNDARAAGTAWEKDDAIGIYMLATGTTDIAEEAENRKYTTPAADGKFTPAEASQAVYFPVDESVKVDFIAYYPHTAPLADNIYKVDVSVQTSPAAIDLLRSDKVAVKDKTTSGVDLTFIHRLSRVEVNVIAGTGFTDADLQGLGITLSKQLTKADYKVLTDELTPVTGSGDKEISLLLDGTAASAIILPQDGTAGRVLTFNMKSNPTFTYSIPADKTFLSGKKTIYNITLALTGVEVTTTIEPWGIQGTINDDADIQ